jgi:hypothetical protein
MGKGMDVKTQRETSISISKFVRFKLIVGSLTSASFSCALGINLSFKLERISSILTISCPLYLFDSFKFLIRYINWLILHFACFAVVEDSDQNEQNHLILLKRMNQLFYLFY